MLLTRGAKKKSAKKKKRLSALLSKIEGESPTFVTGSISVEIPDEEALQERSVRNERPNPIKKSLSSVERNIDFDVETSEGDTTDLSIKLETVEKKKLEPEFRNEWNEMRRSREISPRPILENSKIQYVKKEISSIIAIIPIVIFIGEIVLIHKRFQTAPKSVIEMSQRQEIDEKKAEVVSEPQVLAETSSPAKHLMSSIARDMSALKKAIDGKDEWPVKRAPSSIVRVTPWIDPKPKNKAINSIGVRVATSADSEFIPKFKTSVQQNLVRLPTPPQWVSPKQRIVKRPVILVPKIVPISVQVE